MRITYRWLRDYVDFEWSPEELEDRLTMLGLEVEGVEATGGAYDGVVVAEVLSRDPHPNADRLSVCRVDDGSGTRQIVCGATNFGPGDRVPLILPGHSLPSRGEDKPLEIRKGKLRGVVSEGMMCSGRELGLGEDAEGLMILEREARSGTPLSAYLGEEEEDWVYDLEVTPNRPDWNGVVGIAREVSALARTPLRIPEPALQESGSPAAESVRVRIEDHRLCPRYAARLLSQVSVGPSPASLRRLLEKIGIRSINNVVDISNFVMMESGQPLHSFDFRLLARSADGKVEVIVRGAAPEEPFTGLDGQERRLPGNAVVIADSEKAVALGGIMGGGNSEIGEDTREVLLESACFSPRSIRSTSRRLGLRTDASYRYERGVEVEIAGWASRRAAGLICEHAGASLHPGCVDAREGPFVPIRVPLRFERTCRLLGAEIPASDQIAFLERLGLEPLDRGGKDSCRFAIPSFRKDLQREADLIEEVARIYGVDRIEATPPRGGIGAHEHDPVHDALGRIRNLLAGMGLFEIQAQTLISGDAPGIPQDAEKVALANPLSAEMDILRPSLLPGLLEALRHNAHQGTHDAALFEIGTAFRIREGKRREEQRLALALTGSRHPQSWSQDSGQEDFDAFDLKGRMEILLEATGVGGVRWESLPEPDPLFVEECLLKVGRRILGRLGILNPVLARDLDLRKPVFLAELECGPLLRPGKQGGKHRPLPQFPSIRRDLALLVGEEVPHQRVLDVVRKARCPQLQTVRLFDVFRGKGIPEGRKSLAYAFIYRDRERTLTDEEVSRIHSPLAETLKRELGASIR